MKTSTAAANVDIEQPKDRHDEYKVRHGAVRFLSIPDHRFVMVDGSGPPGEEAFAARMPGVYGMVYGLHFALKRRGVAGKVGPLEGLWWRAEDVLDLDLIFGHERAGWRWTLMIVLPEEATEEELEEHLVGARTKVDPGIASSLRIERFGEGDVAQILHLGPYADERPSIDRLHQRIVSAGFRPRGRHHELYLGDPRRSAPDRLRTILRQPITS